MGNGGVFDSPLSLSHNSLVVGVEVGATATNFRVTIPSGLSFGIVLGGILGPLDCCRFTCRTFTIGITPAISGFTAVRAANTFGNRVAVVRDDRAGETVIEKPLFPI